MSDQSLTLKLVRVKAVDETGGRIAERIGNDEIWLAGFAVDATPATHQLAPFEVYPHFDDGDIKEFRPPKTIFTLKVPGGGAYPKSCLAILLLAEKDSGDLTARAQDAFDEMKDKMEVIIIDRPPLPTDLKELFYKFTGLDDDVFPPQIVSLSITSDDFRWGDGTKMSPETTVEFRGHDGVYYLVYYWEIENLASARPHPGEVIIGGGAGVFHE